MKEVTAQCARDSWRDTVRTVLNDDEHISIVSNGTVVAVLVPPLWWDATVARVGEPSEIQQRGMEAARTELTRLYDFANHGEGGHTRITRHRATMAFLVPPRWYLAPSVARLHAV